MDQGSRMVQALLTYSLLHQTYHNDSLRYQVLPLDHGCLSVHVRYPTLHAADQPNWWRDLNSWYLWQFLALQRALQLVHAHGRRFLDRRFYRWSDGNPMLYHHPHFTLYHTNHLPKHVSCNHGQNLWWCHRELGTLQSRDQTRYYGRLRFDYQEKVLGEWFINFPVLSEKEDERSWWSKCCLGRKFRRSQKERREKH